MDLERNGTTNGHRRILDPATGLPWTESDSRGGPDSALAMPTVLNFSSTLNETWKIYYHTRFDEASRAGRTEVRAMKLDAFLMGIFFERRYKVLSQKMSIEVDDEKDPWQKAIKAGLMQIIRNTPRFRKLMKSLLWAVWDGRAASQVAYEWKVMDLPSGKARGMSAPGAIINSSGTGRDKIKALCLTHHKPLNGDKITHHYDGTPVVLVNRSKVNRLPGIAEKDIVNTELGAGVVLRGTWRQRYIIHSHEWIDADFFDVEEAEAIHGVGIRHFVYWLNTLRLEWLSNVADWCERTGLGVRLWYYQGGNPKSKEEVTRAALSQSDRTNILIPRYGDRAAEGVEYVDTASNGADLLLRLQQHLEDIIERFVIGQTLSAHTEGHGLGGSGVAAMHSDTKQQIIVDDAIDLDETLQQDWLKLVLRFTWPEHKDMPFRLVPNFGSPEAESAMNGIKSFVDMGGKVRMEDGYSILGLPAPEDGDEVLERQEIEMPGMGGQPGGESMDVSDSFAPDEKQLYDEIMGDDEGLLNDGDKEEFRKSGQPARFAFNPSEDRGQPDNAGKFGHIHGGGAKQKSGRSSGGQGSPGGAASSQSGGHEAHVAEAKRQKGVLAKYAAAKEKYGDKSPAMKAYKAVLRILLKTPGADLAHLDDFEKEVFGQKDEPEKKEEQEVDSSALHDAYGGFKEKSYDELSQAVNGHFAGLSTEQAKQSLKNFGIEQRPTSKKHAAELATRKVRERKESWERIQFGQEKPLNASPQQMLSAAMKAHQTGTDISDHLKE